MDLNEDGACPNFQKKQGLDNLVRIIVVRIQATSAQSNLALSFSLCDGRH